MKSEASGGVREATIFAPTFIRVWLITLSLYAVAGCGINEFRDQEQKLKPLVQQRASKEEVVNLLGQNFIMHSKGQTNWESLTWYLGREPTNRLVAVRQRVAKWPNVMFYSTPDMMTWVFLDKDEKVVDFVVGAQ